MGNRWRKIFITPDVPGKTPEVLDYLLTNFAAAGVVQGPADARGIRPYQLDEQGRYEVRLMIDNDAVRTKMDALLVHEGFRSVEERLYEGSKLVQTIVHEPTESSNLPGRKR
jgi:hypothetical protein